MAKINILIIHTAFIGDIVLSTPLIHALYDKYPNAQISYLTTPVGENILKNNPYLKEIIVYDKRGKDKGFMGLLKMAKRLKGRFDMVITPHRYMRSSILSYLTRAKIRMGYDNASCKFLYNKKIKYDENKHEVEKLLTFAGIDTRYEIELFPSQDDIKKIDDIIKSDKKIVILAVGSKWFTKQWPVEYFNDVIEYLETKDVLPIVVGGKDELKLDIKISDKILDLRGKTTLLELAEVIKRADILITNDSSPIHIGSASKKTHIIAIFGPTVKKFGFFPWSQNSEVFENNLLACRPCGLHGGDSCPKGHFRCMKEIYPQIIINRLEEIL